MSFLAEKMHRHYAFLYIILPLVVLIYILWFLVSTFSPDEQELITSDLYQNNVENEHDLNICKEYFEDKRVYVQDRPLIDWKDQPIIYFVTPTYRRREQIAELTRLAQTLLLVPRIHWIVANDYPNCHPYLNQFLQQFNIPFTHLSSPMPKQYRNEMYKPRGVANRRAALKWLRHHNITEGILYFGDDDNTYSLQLFKEIRNTKRVSMFPVGLVANYGVSGPVVRKGKVVGFLDSWVAGRRWPVDMAGFAVSLNHLAQHVNANMPYKAGYEEDYFLRSVALTLDMIEPLAHNCTEILVWHTQTKNHKEAEICLPAKYLNERSNLGQLFRYLSQMGVVHASENTGAKAIISKNGKAKPLNTFLS